MSKFVVNKSIAIKADRAKVWDALTNPEKTAKYFFHCKVYSDWKVGSPIAFKGKVFFVFPIELKGEIVKIEPGRLLQYTLANRSKDGHSGYSTVTDLLTYENGITTVSVTDDVGDGKDAEKRYGRSEKGWEKVLAGLKKVAEEE